MANSRLLALGFRPFYLLAAGFAILAVVLWLLSFRGLLLYGGYLQGNFLHSHEMVFGFAVAVISGFLLTAVRNWTGLATPTGPALAALVSVWLAGRLLIVTGPPILAALVDVLFVPMLAVAVAHPIFKSRNQRNYKIVVLLLLIALCNVVYHLAAMGPMPTWLAYTTIIVALDLLTILYAIVAGRVIPAFTRNAIAGADPRSSTWVEVVAFGSLILIIVVKISSDWVLVPALLPNALVIIAAVAHTFRLAYWQPYKTVGNPLLWMLPVAYSWLPLALLLRVLAQYSMIAPSAWIHALTIGTISGMMLAMMARSALGHTGRDLKASGMDIAAFLFLQLAAILRVIADLLPADTYFLIIVASGALWVLAFGIFLYRYLPMLVRPRIDGQPG
ncbi:MAG: NnrS family protein [Woeseiaceae bacterium]